MFRSTGLTSPSPTLLALMDINGGQQMLQVSPQQYRSPRLSPDRTQLSVEVAGEDGKHNIWIYSLAGAFDFRQLTQTGSNIHAIWTPDGKSLTFASNKDGTWKIYSQPADGSAVPEPLTTGEPGVEQWPESWPPDGSTLSFVKGKPDDSSLWTFSKETLTTQLFHDDKGFDDFGSAFSPDGKWLAYTVVANPAPGIRVQGFPAGGTHQVTEAGESWPVWSGNELFFRILRSELAGMAVSTKSTFGFGYRRPLALQNVRMERDRRDYDTRDGKNFVVIVSVPVAAPTAAATPAPRPRSQINIVLNWFEELETLLAPR
jgi:Tol biopolymer transport system component